MPPELPAEMVEAAAGVLMPYPNLERSHIDMARDALVAAGVPALLEERDATRKALLWLADAVDDHNFHDTTETGVFLMQMVTQARAALRGGSE